MATLKLKPSAPRTARDDRQPLRGRGATPRPTLAEARARRDQDDLRRGPRRDEAYPPPERDAPGARAPRASRPMGDRPGAPGARPAAPRSVPQPVSPAQEGVRLSKRLSELGLASRREADLWIEQGLVRVDGKIVNTLGSRVRPDAQITIEPLAKQRQSRWVTVLLHKPIGYVSGQPEDNHQPAVALVTAANRWAKDPSPRRFNATQLHQLAPAGRLDIDSTGLLVLTQDGRVAKQLIGEGSSVEKEYLVRVTWSDPTGAPPGELMHVFPPEKLELLRHGLALDGEPLRPAKVSWQNEQQLRFVLREGKKRQIRRMCEAVGLHVTGLKRVRIGSVVLGDLPPGQWRYLGPLEKF